MIRLELEDVVPELVAADERELMDYRMDIQSLLGDLEPGRRELLELALAGEPSTSTTRSSVAEKKPSPALSEPTKT